MRKIAWILVFVLLAGLAVPASAVSPAEILGTWYLSYFEFEGFAAVIPGDNRLELNRDATGVLVIAGEEKPLTWELKDYGAYVTEEEGTGDFTLMEDGVLKGPVRIGDGYTHDGFFVREQPPQIEIPAETEAANEDEYFGTYALSMQKIRDFVICFENGEELLKAEIEFALITVSGSGLYYGSGEPIAVMSDYKDNKLIIPADGILTGSPEDVLVISKTETGVMVTCEAVPNSVYYLTPVGASEEAPEETGAGE